MSDTAETANRATEAYERIELMRRLYRIIEAADGKGGVTHVAQQIGVAKASLYRWFWNERKPSYTNLLQIHKAYPDAFPELAILEENK